MVYYRFLLYRGVFFYGSDLDTYFYINPLKDELDGSFLHSIERASDLEAFPITNTCGECAIFSVPVSDVMINCLISKGTNPIVRIVFQIQFARPLLNTKLPKEVK